MSMNILFEAVREVVVKKTGKIDIQTIEYEVWQTPTNDTYKIHDSANPVKAYCDWVLQYDAKDEIVDVFDDEENLIGSKTVNFGKEHIDEFLEWVKSAESEGYEVRTVVI